MVVGPFQLPRQAPRVESCRRRGNSSRSLPLRSSVAAKFKSERGREQAAEREKRNKITRRNHSTMEEFASFSEQPPTPATPQLPPPPPPRDINPFGQPATPESNEGGGIDLNASLEPPRPSTPPPPPPVPSKQSRPSSPAPGSPLPPNSPPPPLPGGEDVGATAASAAAVAVAAGVSGKRKGETYLKAEWSAAEREPEVASPCLFRFKAACLSPCCVLLQGV